MTTSASASLRAVAAALHEVEAHRARLVDIGEQQRRQGSAMRRCQWFIAQMVGADRRSRRLRKALAEVEAEIQSHQAKVRQIRREERTG